MAPTESPSPLRVVKAHAYGNDFLLLPRSAVGDRGDLAALVRAACDRHRGLGADGLIVVDEADGRIDTDLYNADGGPSEVSGNGLRCVAAWLATTRGLEPGASLVIGTGAGPKSLALLERDGRRFTFRADMGPPEAVRQEMFQIGGERVAAVVLRVGNPQCVVLGQLSDEGLHSIAAELAVHPAFPQGTNVELAMVEAPGRVRILIWERGVGPTEASGTGACAAAVAAAAYGGADRTVDVIAPGGTQRVEWTEDSIWLTGWAELVATMEWWQ
jgi:diaminopimelate epimerase